jgi:hypothetical protein
VRDREAFFEDEAGTEIQGCSSTHCEIVDGSVDGKVRDGAAGEEERLDDVGVGRKRKAAGGPWKHSRVAHDFERGISKGWDKDVFDEFGGEFAAAAVAHYDGRIVAKRERAAPLRQVGRGEGGTDRGVQWIDSSATKRP